MPARLKFVVAYDGAAFAGWQSQTNGNTIQDYLERAFGAVCSTRVHVHGSGRTDAGVHALAQCAHVDLPDRRFTGERWVSAVNAGLPAAIRVLRCGYVAETFHARFSARGKAYRYRIWNARVLPPFESQRAWHVSTALDYLAIEKAARLFAGKHDFRSFAANRGVQPESTVRSILAVRVQRAGACITIGFDGDGFLYKMVRLMVGALVQVGRGRSSMVEIAERLSAKTRHRHLDRLVAPANGLILLRVRY